MLTKREKNSIVHAVCIGDGYLRKLPRGKNYQLTVSHTIKQLNFLKWKRDLLEECLDKKINIRINEKWNHDKTEKRKICVFTVSDAKFNKVYPRLYKNKKKILSKKLLNRIDERALAIFYGDEGSAYWRNDRKNRKFVQIAISGFSMRDCNRFVKHLEKKWNIESKIYLSTTHNWGGKKYPVLRIHKVYSVDKFFSLVEKFLIGVLDYKLCKIKHN